MIIEEPKKREARPEWSKIPKDLVLDIEKITGKIVKAEIAWGGYSPSACFLVENDTGEEFFIKGTHPEQTAHGAKSLRQEIYNYKNFSFLQKFAPNFYGEVSFGNDSDWGLGIWDKINGNTALPWTKDKVKRVMQLLYDMHSQVKREDVSHLTDGKDTYFVSDLFLGEKGWRNFLEPDDSKRHGRFVALFENSKEVSDWLDEFLPVLIKHQNEAKDVTEHENVVHFDLRSDNIMFYKKTGNPVVLDWTDACWGALLFDLVFFSICVAAESDMKAKDILAVYEEVSGIKFKNKDVLAVLSVATGFFADNSWREVPEKLPRLRWIQKICFFAGIEWFCSEKEIKFPGVFKA